MIITLELTESEAIYIKDALIDKSIALRTDSKERVMREDDFFSNHYISDRRKANYAILRKVADKIARAYRPV